MNTSLHFSGINVQECIAGFMVVALFEYGFFFFFFKNNIYLAHDSVGWQLGLQASQDLSHFFEIQFKYINFNFF